MIIRVGMAPRAEGLTMTEFQRHWREEHAVAAANIPGLLGYVQNHSFLDERGRPLMPYAGFDACSEIAFDDLAAMDAGFGSPVYQGDVRADENLMIDKPRFFLLLCPEPLVLAAGAETAGVKLMTFLRAHPSVGREELLAVARGPYATALQAAGVRRHVQLVPSPELHAGRLPPACDVVDCAWFDDVGSAREFVNGPAGSAADDVLSGRAFGRERLLASVRVVRDRPAPDDPPSDRGVLG